MAVLQASHFERAIDDIAAHGDNDVLPFDVDTKFLGDCKEDIVEGLAAFSTIIERKSDSDCEDKLHSLDIFSERLLAPNGPSGFRMTTKIHPIWTVYFNAIGIALAEILEPLRSPRAHSYRYTTTGPGLFDRNYSWRRFREVAVSDCDEVGTDGVVVQADISGFYDHVYHHRLENYVRDLLPAGSNLPKQVDILLNKFASGRSFGLPVGGQGSRVLAEVLLTSIDRELTAQGIRWRRYVDDFTLIVENQREAYRALSVLAHALADLGLGLNRHKTSILGVRHFRDYVDAQIAGPDQNTKELREIDLHFDPYSDNADEEYEQLRDTVSKLDISELLAGELNKGQPEAFLISQVSRTLRLLDPDDALDICSTLLHANNIHAFRANWSGIMRGIAAIRGDSKYTSIQSNLDSLLDSIPSHSAHLLSVDTNCLHYLRALRFARTENRASFVLTTYNQSQSITLQRSCIDCWRHWGDRERFLSLRNKWPTMTVEEQRMLWLAAHHFGDDGEYFHKQVRSSTTDRWALGIERSHSPKFSALYQEWASRDS